MPTACWTCRHRTIQCDQAGIPCAKCQKAGLECFQTRPLRWVKGVAIRGKLRGRVLGENRKEIVPAKQAMQPCSKSTPQPALQDPHVHDLDASSKFYLDYCGFSAWEALSVLANILQKTIYGLLDYSSYMIVKVTLSGTYSHTPWMSQHCECV